jgi:hypothetical protein
MEIDFIELGPTPVMENCAQVGDENYQQKSAKEMTAYVNQLYRHFPDIKKQDRIYFMYKYNWHEFGYYGEVRVFFPMHDKIAEKTAYEIERNIPEYWDEEAKVELGLNG